MLDKTSETWNAPARQPRGGKGGMKGGVSAPPPLYPYGSTVSDTSVGGSVMLVHLFLQIGAVMIIVLILKAIYRR